MTYKPLFPIRKASTQDVSEDKTTPGSTKSLNIQPEALEIGDWSTMRFVELLRQLGIRNVGEDEKASEDSGPVLLSKSLSFVELTKAEEPPKPPKPAKPPKPVVPPKEHASNARAANIGEIHYWKTGPHKKIAPGKWIPVTEEEAKLAKQKSKPAQRINAPDHEWGNDLDNRNEDGTVTLYHRTNEDGAKGIIESGKFESKMNTGEAYFSTRDHGEVSGYGDHVIAVDVDPGFVSLNDEFTGGEAHVTVDQRNQRAFKNMRVLEGGGLEPKTLDKMVVRPKDWEAAGNEVRGMFDEMSKRDTAWRGMTEAEFKNTVAVGLGVESKGDYSASSEGTQFADHPGDAESYVNFGRDDPRKTNKPTYLVEVEKDYLVSKPDGYLETKRGQGVPHSKIKSVHKMYADGDGQIVAELVDHKSVETSKEPSPLEAEVSAVEEAIRAKTTRREAGQGGHTKLQKAELSWVLDNGTYGLLSAGKNPKLEPEMDHIQQMERHKELEKDLVEAGLMFTEVVGHYEGEEKALLVMAHEMSLDEVKELGRKYNQDSVIHSVAGKNEMHFTTGENEGKHHKGSGYEIKSEATDYYSIMEHDDGKSTKFALNFDWDKLHKALTRAFRNLSGLWRSKNNKPKV